MIGVGSVLATRHTRYEMEINSFWVYQPMWKLWRFCSSGYRQRAFAMALPGAGTWWRWHSKAGGATKDRWKVMRCRSNA